jgi:hypothetical protein
MNDLCYCGADDCPSCRPWNFKKNEYGERVFVDPLGEEAEQQEESNNDE